MKKIIHILPAFILMVAAASCSKKGVEVVSQDLNYQIDPNFVHIAIPEAFQFDPTNILYLQGQTNLTLTGRNNGQQTVIDQGNTVSFRVKLRRPLTQDVTVRLVKDEALRNQYAGDITNFKDFPEGTFKISEVTLPAGKTEASIAFELDKINDLNQTPGYFVPLRLEIKNKVDGLKISEINYSVFVKLNMTVVKDNIDASNNPISGTAFNSTITFDSNKPTGLSVLKDGNTSGSVWYPSNSSTYLAINLPQEEVIKGIIVNSPQTTYHLGSFDVKAEEGGAYVVQGKFAVTSRVGTLYVKFKTPVTTKSIRLENILAIGGGQQPDIAEVRLVK